MNNCHFHSLQGAWEPSICQQQGLLGPLSPSEPILASGPAPWVVRVWAAASQTHSHILQCPSFTLTQSQGQTCSGIQRRRPHSGLLSQTGLLPPQPAGGRWISSASPPSRAPASSAVAHSPRGQSGTRNVTCNPDNHQQMCCPHAALPGALPLCPCPALPLRVSLCHGEQLVVVNDDLFMFKERKQ